MDLMFEVLKAAAAKAVELWSGVPETNEDGRPKSVELPNGVVLIDPQHIQQALALEWAPTAVVDDWYSSTLPSASRCRKIPLNLLDELLVNSKLFLATCEFSERGAAYGLKSISDSYAYDYVRVRFTNVRETAEMRFALHKPQAGRNQVEPLKTRQSGT